MISIPVSNTQLSKKYLKSTDDDNWVREEEEAVLARVAAHEATMGALKASSPAK